MNINGIVNWPKLALLACGLVAVATITGCGFGLQARVAGQTLPSAYYLRDDVQYFPHGPEEKLPRLTAELDRYKVQQQAIQDGLLDEAP